MSFARKLLAGYVGIPAYQLLKKTPLTSGIELLKNSWTWSKVELEAYQIKRIKSLLIHAEKNISFYKTKFADASFSPEQLVSLSDLESIPPLTREELLPLQKSIQQNGTDLSGVVKGSSSGTSGIPVSYYKDRSTIGMGKAALFFGQMQSGWYPGAKTANVWGNPKTVNILWKRPASKLNAFLMNELRIPACNLNDPQELDYAVSTILEKNPTFITGYTNSLRLIAEHIANISSDFRCGRVFTTAETLLTPTKNIIENSLGPVTDMYGCSEINGIAFQCKHCGLYHVTDPHVYLEYEPLEHGDGFSLLVTDLDNYAMPFIRYRVGDIVEPVQESSPCPSGTHWSSLSAIQGRVSQIIHYNDHYLNPITYFGDSMGRMLNSHLTGLKGYQTIWTGSDFVTTLYMQKKPEIMVLNKLNSILLDRLSGFDTPHKFVTVTGAPVPSKSGKLSFFLDKSGKSI